MTRAARRAPGPKSVLFAIALALGALALAYVAVRWLRAPDAIATLAEKTGTVDRDFGAQVGAWQPALQASKFFLGDGVRTDKAATAMLELSDRSKLRLENSTVIRFLSRRSAKQRQRFELQMGQAEFEAGTSPLTFDTEIGAATIAPGSKITLQKSNEGTRYEVSVGRARFETDEGKSVEVSAGQGLVIGIGAARLETYDVQKPSEAPPPAVSAPVPSASATVPSPPNAAGDVSAHVTGPGASARAPGESTFSSLGPGDRSLAAGTTLRLASGTSAQVARGGQQATLRGAGEFVVGESGKPFIVADGGGVSLTGSEAEVEVAVPGGSIVAKLGAHAELGIRKDSTHVSVSAGTVAIETPQGKEELAAGEEATLAAKGGTDVAGRGPGYVDLVVGAGASFAVHDPSPPTAIGFTTGSACPEGAVVEVTGQPNGRSRGNGTVSVLVTAGAHRYVVRCVRSTGISKEVAASGSVAVLHDSGTARIPRTAPATLVDTDGRNYTVLYQNVLPKISVRWPNAPAGTAFTLAVTAPGGKSSSYSSATASYSFPSGALREGVHRLVFSGGGTRSRETRIDIKFDNAAPTATLTSPQNGSFGPGSAVTVAGVSLEGFRISVGGTSLPLDDQLRFSGQAVVPAGQRALAVEFVHPNRGVQYYLRKCSGH